MHYAKIWLQLTNCAFSTYAANRLDSLSYFLGKLLRFAFFLLMIVSIFRFTHTFAGYTRYEALIFFLTFSLVDSLGQTFRGLYNISGDVNKGTLDLVLAKPVNPLFYYFSRTNDPLDIIFLLPVLGLLGVAVSRLPAMPTASHFIGYLALLSAGILINVSIHILSGALSMWTEENDNIIWFYRRALMVGYFPPTILPEIWRIIFTYLIPVVIMVAFPAQALLGLLNFKQYLLALVLTAFFFGGSLLIWKVSLRRYSSASS